MKLVKFSVTNFRSISKAHAIPIANTTVLVGKNNEGKSNLLKALSVAMSIIADHALRMGAPRSQYIERYELRLRREYGHNLDYYDWKTDFPISLQDKKGAKQTTFHLEFELAEEEISSFKDEVKSNLNGTLPLEITIGEKNRPTIRVVKRGRGSKTLNAKSAKITDYIARRISFNYIPAVRTHEQTLKVIDTLLSRELMTLEDNEEYKNALKTITELQRPILDSLSERIKEPLSEFLPNIRDVKINMNEGRRRVMQRVGFDVIVDDGTPTSIEHKGDGVKSLAALGLLKNKSYKTDVSIIAIEEPESHLHPGAIHQLNEIIEALEGDNQIVITTHNPLFVNREDIKANIIVESGKATPAKNIAEIRKLLGIKASDNLINARYVLVVEGEEDKIALTALLPLLSAKLQRVLRDNLLVIDPIGGAGNLSYKLSVLKNSLCTYHSLLDNDEEGRNAFHKAAEDNYAETKNTTFTRCSGMVDSEFEDCLNTSLYSQFVLAEFGVNLDATAFRGNKKWSARMKATFEHQGKLWNKAAKKKAKYVVAKCIELNPRAALHSHKRNSIDALVQALEKMVGE